MNKLSVATLALLFAALLHLFPAGALAQNNPTADVLNAAQTGGAAFDWDANNKRTGLLNQMRGLATVLLLISVVVSAVYVGVTGRSGIAIFAVVGAIVLYGGFWIVLLIVEGFGAGPTISDIVATNPNAGNLVVAPIIKDFTDYGIAMLTTVVMPFTLIYGFWMALGVASGETQNSGIQIKNYVVGGTVAIGASIIVQVFNL